MDFFLGTKINFFGIVVQRINDDLFKNVEACTSKYHFYWMFHFLDGVVKWYKNDIFGKFGAWTSEYHFYWKFHFSFIVCSNGLAMIYSEYLEHERAKIFLLHVCVFLTDFCIRKNHFLDSVVPWLVMIYLGSEWRKNQRFPPLHYRDITRLLAAVVEIEKEREKDKDRERYFVVEEGTKEIDDGG